MSYPSRLLAITAILGLTAIFCPNSLIDAYASTTTPLNGHVYLIRGLLGDIFSRGLDRLAKKISSRGLAASAHALSDVDSLTEEIINKYENDPSSSPIILIGHSTGGDAIISMAERMRKASVPVALAFSLDPTRIADRVPDNVGLFINIFQGNNPIGGGIVKSEKEFPGRLINVDLQEHTEIIHITLDKSSKIHDPIVDEIIELVTQENMKQTLAPRQLTAQSSLPNCIRPFFLRYRVPRDEPIELWDCGIRITLRPKQTIQSVGADYRIPVWAIAQINKIDLNKPTEPGIDMIIPLHMYRSNQPEPNGETR
jgi:hypothetical protein